MLAASRIAPAATLTALLFCSANAWAQAAPEGGEEGAAAEEPHASPEVQKQVGMGTEKEDPSQPPPETGPADSAPTPQKAEKEDEDFGHGFQFGLRSAISAGYKILVRFDDSPLCEVEEDGEEQQVCAYGTPPSLDLALSFAIFDSIEPYAWMRLGLGEHSKTDTAAYQFFGVGLRVYTMSDSKFKLFFEPALAVELEGGTDNAPPDRNYDTDFIVHGHFGLQYDFLKHLGLYASLGPNVSFVRAIGTELEASIGLQGRAP